MKPRPARPVRIGYFGKLPAHGDFVRATSNGALAGLLDEWLAEVMLRLTAEPRWKRHYDALQPLDYAFVGTRSRLAVGGRLLASCDQSQRRFPFLTMSAFEIDDPAAFVALSPLVLGALWQRHAGLCAGLPGAADPAPALLALAGAACAVEPGAPAHAAAFGAFLDQYSVAGLQALLGAERCGGSLRQLILALGLLLRPVRESGAARLEKSLLLPLPAAPGLRWLAASFWLHLAVPFLLADFELSLFFGEAGAGPHMVLGFCGADPHTLQAIIDPAAAAGQQIAFEQLDWVGPQAAAEAGLRQLSACLEQGRLSLRAARALFDSTFA